MTYTKSNTRTPLALAGWLVLFLVAAALGAQKAGNNNNGRSGDRTSDAGRNASEAAASSRPAGSGSPHDDFQAGEYGRAAEAFAKRAEKRPKDAKVQLNLGSALHHLEDYEGARSAFERVLKNPDRRLQAKAAYDLGNTAYRQGRLDAAIERYREALTLNPDDEDAKHNLEFVQMEQQRRQEQAQERQDRSKDEQSDSEDQSDPSEEDGESESAQDQSGEEGNQGDSSGQEEGRDNQQEQKDSDGDGLTDQQERQAENPTDPQKSDTDGDGRSDGEEDANRNGRVDSGESDPNRVDEPPGPESEGDGGQDEQEDEATEGGQPGDQSRGSQEQEITLDPEQVQRLLAALEDRRPPGSRGKEPAGKRARRAKDW